jgi:hypothetical protein
VAPPFTEPNMRSTANKFQHRPAELAAENPSVHQRRERTGKRFLVDMSDFRLSRYVLARGLLFSEGFCR